MPTDIFQVVDAWIVTDGHPVACRCDLTYDRDQPLLLGLRLWHPLTPHRGANWQVMRDLVRGALKGGQHPVGLGAARAVMTSAHHVWMLQLDLQTRRRRELVHFRSVEMGAFVESTLNVVPLAGEDAWTANLVEPVDEKVKEWAAFLCPRCHKAPRGLLGGCTDPICAAEEFRATLALERQIEATDD